MNTNKEEKITLTWAHEGLGKFEAVVKDNKFYSVEMCRDSSSGYSSRLNFLYSDDPTSDRKFLTAVRDSLSELLKEQERIVAEKSRDRAAALLETKKC